MKKSSYIFNILKSYNKINNIVFSDVVEPCYNNNQGC
jgi:hypothetical protein